MLSDIIMLWIIRVFAFFVRFKMSGPDGNNYWVRHETHVGGSDADDS
jgi:hypothetical protein